jgi:nitrate reductase gamma subunit
LLSVVKIFVLLTGLWAVIALAVQVLLTWGGGRREYSQRTGSPWRGVVYIFTVAMTPAHKESIRRHPAQFALGLLMHLGVILALAIAVLLLAWPEAGERALALLRPAMAIALLAGLCLCVRRLVSKNLRVMSVPDDYLAIFATCGLLAFACFTPIDGRGGESAFLIYAGLLLLYLPLGKLRHAVFFFVARGNYGLRLGYRGVYPPPARLE